MKKEKLLLLMLSVTMALCMLLSGCGKGNDKGTAGQAATSKDIKATLTIVYEDATTKDVVLEVKESTTLGKAMFDAGLISQYDYNVGFVTELDNAIADYNKDQAWWCLQDKDGNQLSQGINDIKLSNGDLYKFVYTVGF